MRRIRAEGHGPMATIVELRLDSGRHHKPASEVEPGQEEGPESTPSPSDAKQESELRLILLDRIQPCPIQPRVNVSVPLIEELASSMQAGRHQPLLEVEPLEGQPECYQIVCGEQRWRAARQAGLQQVLVRVLPQLGYLERFRKQLEENRLRSALDPVEEAHAITVTWNTPADGAARGSNVEPLQEERAA